MTVKELIALLGDMEPEQEVLFQYNYGDHWRTEVAQKIRQVSEGRVAHSDYHRMDKVVDADDVEDEDKLEKLIENSREVVLISA